MLGDELGGVIWRFHQPVKWVADVLFTLPAPTEEWAGIVDSLAWPIILVFLVLRFRKYLKAFLDTIAESLTTIAERLRTDHVKTPWFELTPNSNVITLDPKDVSDSTVHYEPDDIERMERLFEFIAESGNMSKLLAWLDQQYPAAVDIADFITNPAYATARSQAVADLNIGAE